MHTTEHTDLDGDALTVTRNGELVWVTVTKGGDELTFGPISAHALEAREPLGSYVRHEDPARNADGALYCTAEHDEFACSREDGHDGPHVAATCDVQNSICEVWPAAEARPLTPDAINASVKRAEDAYHRARRENRPDALGLAVLAALIEPTEDSEVVALAEVLGDFAVADEHSGDRDDMILARHLHERGVRVVSEDGAA